MLQKEDLLTLSYGSYRVIDIDTLSTEDGRCINYVYFKHTKRKNEPITTILREDSSGFCFEVYYKNQHIPQTIIKNIKHFIENHPSYRLAFLLHSKTFRTVVRDMEQELQKESGIFDE